MTTLDLLRTADPSVWRAGPGGTVVGTAPAATDLFIDPVGDSDPAGYGGLTGYGDLVGDGVHLNAPRLLVPAPEGDFWLHARIEVDFGSTFDAGVLLLWAGDRTWGKLCFEFSPQGRPMVVSVVTRGLSDDANGFTVEGHTAWLRVARVGSAYAFHASTDGRQWQFVRHFRLDASGDAGRDVGGDAGGDGPLRVGLGVQSPMGPGCVARFDEITLSPTRLADLRDGS